MYYLDIKIFALVTLLFPLQFEAGEMVGFLIGDAGYPCRKYLLTPLAQPQTQPERRYNLSLSTTRVCVERVFGQWKRRFPIVGSTIRLSLNTAVAVIVATAVLFNISKDLNDVLENDIDHDIGHDQLLDLRQLHVPANAIGNAVRRDIINRYFT